MEGFHMTNEFKTLLNDEILHFLYSNGSFQGLAEEEQLAFLTRFQNHELFKEMIEISMALEEMITEVEATMPKMQDKDYLFSQQEQKKVLKDRTVVAGNIYYVPFNELENMFSPLIIALQQSDSMGEFESFCKGTILPLFNLSATQRRDLIVIPFGETASAPLYFKNGILDLQTFEQFIDEMGDGDAKIVPVIDEALAIFKQDSINCQRDLMIITDNQFTDFNDLLIQDYTEQLNDLDVDVSVIAMSEIDFEVQPITFADKVFFANE